MSIFTRKENKKEDKPVGSPNNTPAENDLLNKIDNAQLYAEGGIRYDIEKDWDDEYKIHIGKQWETSKGKRTDKGKKRNFNSQDNLVLPMVENMRSPFTACPEPDISGVESEDETAGEVLNDTVAFILDRNTFRNPWKKIVNQFIKYGPAIGYVSWDQHWIGGSGPDRWIGEVRVAFLKKEEFFPDPAILDLEERMQECSYINLKQRKKLEWFKEVWPEKGQYVLEDNVKLTPGMEDEGQDPKQAWLISHFHKGVPYFVPDEWKEIFLEKAQKAEEEEGLPYYAKDLRDMAAGTLKGVHCAYKAGDILLDYVPYIYDDGLYPFVFKVLYVDEKQPWGMGEIRNVVIPQVLHNLADEIELGAMRAQGLGGGRYNKGAMSETQKEELLDNNAKTNAWNEVNDIHAFDERQPVQIPANIINYKESKKNIIDTISQNTAILQGVSPGANVPYSTIAELGSRADSRTRDKGDILENFMVDMVKLIISRVVQFYTEDRKYRILGEDKQAKIIQREAFKTLLQIANVPQGTPPEQQMQAMINLLMYIKTQIQKPKTGTVNRGMLVREWERPSGDGTAKEQFIPEFDVKVKVRDEKPTDRNYWSNIVTNAIANKVIGPRAFWSTIINGKIPDIEDILDELGQLQQAQAQAQSEMLQSQQQHEAQDAEAERQTKLLGQRLTNDTQLKMTTISAMAKAGARR